MVSLKWKQVSAWRMTRHRLAERADRRLLPEVVADINGLQAQVMSAAEQALWARADNISPADVQQALWSDRSLVKTWAMRGTLHLLAAHDYPSYIAAFSALTYFRRPVWLKYFGVTADELETLIRVMRATLNGSGMTRERLAAAVAKKMDRPELRELLLSGWGGLLKPAAFHGQLCFGPSAGSNVTFVRPDKWLGAWEAADPESALLNIARRYLKAYGPARVEEFARWMGLQVAEARRVFRGLADELVAVSVEGWQARALAATIDGMRNAASPRIVRLLPYFDPYTIAVARHVEYLMPGDYRARVYRAAGWISPVVLVDGRIAGVWEYKKRGAHVAVNVEMFTPATTAIRRDIATEVARLGQFLNTEVRLKDTDG